MRVNKRFPNDWNAFNITLVAAAGITVALSLAQLMLPHGQMLSPGLLILQYTAMGSMMLMHIVRHLGIKMALTFFVSLAVVEYLCEVFNILTHGLLYGSLVYTNLLGPKLTGVPIGVPFAMTFLVWPIFALLNIIIYKRVVVFNEGQGMISIIIFGVLCGFVMSSMGFTTEPMMQALGAYEYPGVLNGSEKNAYFGAPVMAQTGWMIVIAIMVTTLITVIGPRFGEKRNVPLHGLFDSAPIVVFGTMVFCLAFNALALSQTMATLWSAGMIVLLGALSLYMLTVKKF